MFTTTQQAYYMGKLLPTPLVIVLLCTLYYEGES